MILLILLAKVMESLTVGRALGMGAKASMVARGWMQARDLAMGKDLVMARALALTGKVALMGKAGTMGKALMALELMERGLAKRVVLAKAFDQAGCRAAVSCLMQLAQ